MTEWHPVPAVQKVSKGNQDAPQTDENGMEEGNSSRVWRRAEECFVPKEYNS